MLLVFLWAPLRSQNLVPNPSFEDTVSCPTSTNQLNRTKFWINPTQCTPDYYNSCSVANGGVVNVPNNGNGNQLAHLGEAYVGIYGFAKGFPNSSREYVQVNLSTSLVNSHKYLVSFFVSLADGSQYSISSLGACFSSASITGIGCNYLNYIPQIENKSSTELSDKSNWVLIEDTLTALGGEQFITIGNFRTDNASDTLFLGLASTWNAAYYYIDDISVVDVATLGINSFHEGTLEIYPNPAHEILTVENQNADYEILICNLIGREILRKRSGSPKIEIDLNDFDSGIYFITVKTNSNTYSRKFIKE